MNRAKFRVVVVAVLFSLLSLGPAFPGEPQNDAQFIGSMGVGIYAEDPEIQEFAASLAFIVSQVVEDMEVAPVELPFGFLFVSGKEMIRDHQINADYLPFFNQAQKDIILRERTPDVDCFLQQFNFNGRVVVMAANDTSKEGVRAGQLCAIYGLRLAFGHPFQGLGHDDSPSRIAGLFSLFSEMLNDYRLAPVGSEICFSRC